MGERTRRVAVAVVVLVLVGSVLLAGAAGLVVAVCGLATLAVAGVAFAAPGEGPRRSRPRPGPPVADAPFRAYRSVAEQLSWAAVSPRHYDVVTRPLLVRLAAARLAEHHRVDLWSERDRARALIGEDVWPWLDPGAEPVRDSQPPGVPRSTLTRIVERLESL